MTLENIQEIAKEIFSNSLVLVELVNNPEIRHIYLNQFVTGEQIKELEENFRILYVAHTYDEDDKRINQKTVQVILVTMRGFESPKKELVDLGLPDICPNCNKKVEWDWEMANFYDEQITNDATCPECDAVFVEIMQVVSWEKKETNTNNA